MAKGKKRTPEQWLALFEEHQSSGLSAAEFCRRNDIHPKTFSAHKA
ncbi:IS66 family insertion sequence element accessory protein TnpA, partial [Photobacterium indicum]